VVLCVQTIFICFTVLVLFYYFTFCQYGEKKIIYICIEVVYGRGRPIDSYKTIVSRDDDDEQ